MAKQRVDESAAWDGNWATTMKIGDGEAESRRGREKKMRRKEEERKEAGEKEKRKKKEKIFF